MDASPVADVDSEIEARSIASTRTFDAPRALVWKLWTEPEHIVEWWGPNGFRNTIHEMNVKPGGSWRFVMHGPDGTDYQNHVRYVEVHEPERLVWDHISGPLFRATATFEEAGPSRTTVSMRMVFDSAELRNRVATEFGAVEGLSQTLGRLEDALARHNASSTTRAAFASTQPFVTSRVFDAPRELVWKAWTEPERMAQWFGPKGSKVTHAENDLRPGGRYHYALTMPDGTELWGLWVYREIVEGERIVLVMSFSNREQGVTRHPMSPEWPLKNLTTISFESVSGGTKVTIQWQPIEATEAEVRVFDASRASMNGGWSGTFDQLADYLAAEQR